MEYVVEGQEVVSRRTHRTVTGSNQAFEPRRSNSVRHYAPPLPPKLRPPPCQPPATTIVRNQADQCFSDTGLARRFPRLPADTIHVVGRPSTSSTLMSFSLGTYTPPYCKQRTCNISRRHPVTRCGSTR
ncbi:hypothetical protein HPB52_003496 [Rhipicephalus sanguineus]|uniref:Uncharacterized protein n=1 Tax=Rhipicephalus sanguineus TaxID=34632 RepID=A0A9D4QA57_RHISA|nr:hypothetical protein HPB52_003496 [Rhipicephalus sanguineus]